MKSQHMIRRCALCALLLFGLAATTYAQKGARAKGAQEEFGPIVRAYLGYLQNQQEVVDDRISRHEIERAYYVRNSNRIRALRRVAVRIARETGNDYLPELEAVALDEFDTMFDPLPKPQDLKVGEVFNYQFRFLEAIVSGRDKFYVFARLDPYEQAELRKQGVTEKAPAADATTTRPAAADSAVTTATPRPRRTISP